jgi:chemotaxis methyl-accepting protein methylase
VLLESDATETAALYQDFLIRVTGFFRDPESFEILAQRVFPSVCESRSPKAPVRIWVPGCASGEEVYSIAIALMEYFGERPAPAGIQIFGTDVSDAALEKARAGVYLENITQEVSAERSNALLCQAKRALPDCEKHPRPMRLCTPRHHSRSPVLQIGLGELSQSTHLSRCHQRNAA